MLIQANDGEPDMEVKEKKQELRERIWRHLRENKLQAFPFKKWDLIPNFVGSKAAADRLRETPDWKRAKVVYANPDYAQKKIRQYALLDGKTLIVSSPRLTHGFLLVEPNRIKGKEGEAATIRGAARYGKEVREFPQADLIVKGSVAVDRNGNRLGKGAGYGDQEIGILKNAGSITKNTTIVTTVHEDQIVDFVPTESHDARVNLIVTPDRVIRVGSTNEKRSRPR
jgi:5-formyltetrahydrofolate cyclo-ligase